MTLRPVGLGKRKSSGRCSTDFAQEEGHSDKRPRQSDPGTYGCGNYSSDFCYASSPASVSCASVPSSAFAQSSTFAQPQCWQSAQPQGWAQQQLQQQRPSAPTQSHFTVGSSDPSEQTMAEDCTSQGMPCTQQMQRSSSAPDFRLLISGALGPGPRELLQSQYSSTHNGYAGALVPYKSPEGNMLF